MMQSSLHSALCVLKLHTAQRNALSQSKVTKIKLRINFMYLQLGQLYYSRKEKKRCRNSALRIFLLNFLMSGEFFTFYHSSNFLLCGIMTAGPNKRRDEYKLTDITLSCDPIKLILVTIKEYFSSFRNHFRK